MTPPKAALRRSMMLALLALVLSCSSKPDEASTDGRSSAPLSEFVPLAWVANNEAEQQEIARLQQANKTLCKSGAQITRGRDRLKVTVSSDVLFDFDKSNLKPSAKEALAEIKAQILDAYPKASLVIEGHTDSEGSDDYNIKLSERRAASVATWLKSRDITSSRISQRGYGEGRPRVPNDSDANRAQNRRVEIVLRRKEPLPQVTRAQASGCDAIGACCALERAEASSEGSCQGATIPLGQAEAGLEGRGLEANKGHLSLQSCLQTRAGFVWITSTGERKVAKFDERSGAQIFRVETYGKKPQRTAVGEDGSVWITNRDSGNYVHIGTDGEVLCASPYRSCHTRAAAVDAQGDVWIGCYDDRKIIKVSPTEVLEESVKLHQPGSHPREEIEVPRCKELAMLEDIKMSPYGMVADSRGGLWVTQYNGPVLKIDTRRNTIILRHDYKGGHEEVKKKGKSDCWRSYGITIDRDDNPWLMNMDCGNVVKLDGETGKIIGFFAPPADKPEQKMHISRAGGLDRRGHIWASDHNTPLVHEFAPDGRWIKSIDTTACSGKGSGNLGVGTDSEGHLWIVSQSAGKVTEMTTDGKLLGCYPDGKTPNMVSPYTYSDLTGSSRELGASKLGRANLVVARDAPLSWRMLQMRAQIPATTTLCLRWRAAKSARDLGQKPFGPATCLSAGPSRLIDVPMNDTPRGQALEIELGFGTAQAGLAPIVSDLSVAGRP